MAAVHLFNQIGYFSGSDAFGIKLDNHAFQDVRVLLVVRQSVLMKFAVSVSGNLNFDLAKLRINLAIIDAVSGIARVPSAFCIRIIA